jgi:hypothetical protein
MELHTPAALPPEERALVPIVREAEWISELSRAAEKTNSSCPTNYMKSTFFNLLIQQTPDLLPL